jgi:hypothetical protein
MIKIDSELKEEGQKILRNIFEKRRANHPLRDQPDHPLYEIVGLMQIVAKDVKKRKAAIKKK